MRTRARLTMEWIVLLYFLSYLPNIVLTRLLTSAANPSLGRPPTGLEVLPSSLILNLLMTYMFVWLWGWHRDAHSGHIAGLRVPVPTRHTFLSGIGTALVLFTVPLSLTFTNVSIPFIQLLMRGDILVIAPLVELGRAGAGRHRARAGDTPAGRPEAAAAGTAHRCTLYGRLLHPTGRHDPGCQVL
jgi:hypothetical protein